MEPRQITRIEAAKFARAAYDLGVRYIGGCCGFESYHIRAMAEELMDERKGILPEASKHSDMDYKSIGSLYTSKKCCKDYWWNREPCTGRNMSTAMNKHKCPHLFRSSLL